MSVPTDHTQVMECLWTRMLDQLVTSLDPARHHLSSGIPRLNILFYENCFSFRPSHSRNTVLEKGFFFLLTELNTLDLQNFHQQILNVSNNRAYVRPM